MGGMFASPWLAHPWRRRALLAVAALIFAVLAAFPRPYAASTLLAPDDSAAGLSGLFGGGGGGNLLASLLGGRGTIEADLLIGRSQAVIEGVARRLHDEGEYRDVSLPDLETRLRHKVDVQAVRGSILQISTVDHDPARARRVIEDFVAVLRQRLTTLSRDQAVDKRGIARGRMDQATADLNEAEKALNDFKASHHFSGPDIQLSSAIAESAALQTELEASHGALLTLERFAGPENMQVQALVARIAVLKKQLTDVQSRQPAGLVSSLATLNPQLTQYAKLIRNERYATNQYDIYRRYLETLTVQEVAAPLNLDVIDPPFIDPKRQFNPMPLGALVLILILAVIGEFYMPTLSARSS